LTVELDLDTLGRLETCTPSRENVPRSLDIFASVAASSMEAIDRGDFKVVIAPSLGANGAGRGLGRFADLFGAEGRSALERVAQAEESTTPGSLGAELSYLPQRFRSANVAVRPAVRKHEIVFGVTPGVPPANGILAADITGGGG